MKKIVILTIAILFTANLSFAQFDLSFTSSRFNSDKMISSVTKAGIVVVESRYQLTKDEETYGNNKRNYYGLSTSIAVIANRQLFLTDKAVEPWKYDTAYTDRVYEGTRVKDTYGAQLSEIKLTTLAGEEITIDVDSVAQAVATPDSLYTIQIDKEGFEFDGINRSVSVLDGYMLWVVADEKENKLIVRPCSAKVDDTIAPPSYIEKPILGGLFLQWYSVGIGRVVFPLSAIAVEHEDNWRLTVIGDAKPKNASPANLGGSITPAQKNKKDSSNQFKNKKEKGNPLNPKEVENL